MTAITELLLASHSDDSGERTRAREAIRSALTNSGAVLNGCLDSPDPFVRRAAADAVSLLESSEQQKPLLAKALNDSDGYVVAHACWVIEEIRAANLDLWDEVSVALSNINWHVRQAALSAVPFCHAETEAKLTAISKCAIDAVWQVRAQVPLVLAEMRTWNNQIAGILIALLKDQEAGVRKTSTQALTELEPEIQFIEKNLPPLLDDGDWDVRVYACEVAAHYGENCKFAQDALEQNLLITYPELQRVAKLALVSILKK